VKVFENGFLGGLFILQQLFQQGIVVVRKAFQHLEPCLDFPCLVFIGNIGDLALLVLVIDVGPFQSQIDCTNRHSIAANGNLSQHQWRCACRLQHFQCIANPQRCLVDLVEENCMGYAEFIQIVQNQLQFRDLLFIGFDNDDSEITQRQDRFGFIGKFNGTGTIDKGKVAVEMLHRCEGCLHAHSVGSGLGRSVTHRIAAIYRILALNCAGSKQY